MANEAVQVEGPYEIHDFTVANGSDGSDTLKGTLGKLSTPRTVAASSAADVFAGIYSVDKKGGNGKTEIGLWTTGTFVLKNSGVEITAGKMVSLSGANLIKAATAGELLTGAAFGKALQTIAASGTGEVKIGVLV